MAVVPSWTSLSLRPALSTPVVVPIPPASLERRLDAPAAASAPAPDAGARPATAAAPRSPAAPGGVPVRPLPPASGVPGWRAVARLGLAAGGFGILVLTAWRFARFGRLLACARPAPDAIAQRAAALAARLGLRRVPPDLVVPARIPPML